MTSTLASLRRQIRLLPFVIALGTCLLVLKGAGLFHAAEAEVSATGKVERSDPVAVPPRTLADNSDPAADDGEIGSPAEVDVLTSLTRRRSQLDAREQQLAMRESVIAAAEQRVDAKIAQLQALQAALQKAMGEQDAEQQKQVASLVKTYSAMKPKDAARIFNGLDEDVQLSVASQMKSDVLAPVLAAMEPANAQKLTLRLANRLKVTVPPAPPPVPATAAMTAPTPPTPAPEPVASNPPAPATAATAPAATTPVPPAAAAVPPAKPHHSVQARAEHKIARITAHAAIATAQLTATQAAPAKPAAPQAPAVAQVAPLLLPPVATGSKPAPQAPAPVSIAAKTQATGAPASLSPPAAATAATTTAAPAALKSGG